MFSVNYYNEIKNAFDRQMALLDKRYNELQCSKLQYNESHHSTLNSEANGNISHISALSAHLLSEKKEEILRTLAGCTEDEAQALTFLYSAMPFSDLMDYPSSLFLAYAKHGVFLWNHGAFAGRVPEKLFANYVLHYRVNNEDIADTRGFFYDRVKEAVDLDEAASGTMYDTAIDVNYWCAREATYRSTDGRTQNPRTMYGTATGRCGEESTFAVTALRSIGIPARQIYAPLWTHCDDNHAWVELWCDGKWYFLGACEPEEELNRGWFTGPASRAVMLHSRWFGQDMPEDRQVGPKGMAKVLNHMERYADTVELEVKVEDEDGNPVPRAKVDFQVLNHGSFGSVAVVYTGSEAEDCGIARLLTGFGDMYISVSAGTELAGAEPSDTETVGAWFAGMESAGVESAGMDSVGTESAGIDSVGIEFTGTKSIGKKSEQKKLYGEAMVSLSELKNANEITNSSDRLADGEKAKCKIVLKEKPECWDGWKELDIHAPEIGHMYDGVLTAEQQETGEKRLAQAAEYRQKKLESFYDEREAERILGRFEGEEKEKIKEILHTAHGNIGEIVRFLEWDGDCLVRYGHWENADARDNCQNPSSCQQGSPKSGQVRFGFQEGSCQEKNCREHFQKSGKGSWKLKVLQSLREKDYWDIKAEILIDCCINAFPYAGNVPEEVFYRFLLCPRVSIEMLQPCRMALKKYWEEYTDDSTKEALRQNPGCLTEMVDQWIISIPETEYENLITSPLGCLRGGIGSRHSKQVFCVNLYRALGIPARLNYFDDKIEYYQDGKFVTCNGEEKSCSLTLCEDGSLKLSDWEHYSVERFEGDGFRHLGLWGQLFQMEGSELDLQVAPGIYRIVTTNRKKDGDQLAKVAVFEIRKGESRRVVLSMRETPVEDMLTRIKVKDFVLKTMETVDREDKWLSALAEGGKALFLWLGVTREPTEHILNELYEKQEEFASLKTPIYAILKAPEDLENATLRRTLEALPMIHTLLDDFGENYHDLAKAVGQEPGKLPLAAILNGQQECIYSDAGYNVGLADMLYKILI